VDERGNVLLNIADDICRALLLTTKPCSVEFRDCYVVGSCCLYTLGMKMMKEWDEVSIQALFLKLQSQTWVKSFYVRNGGVEFCFRGSNQRTDSLLVRRMKDYTSKTSLLSEANNSSWKSFISRELTSSKIFSSLTNYSNLELPLHLSARPPWRHPAHRHQRQPETLIGTHRFLSGVFVPCNCKLHQ